MREVKQKSNRGGRVLGLAAIAALLLCGGCATTDSATTLSITRPDGTRLTLVFPKELTADDLKLSLNAMRGTLSLQAKRWESRNVEVIKAAGVREAANVKAASGLANKVSSGLAEGAVKGAAKAILP